MARIERNEETEQLIEKVVFVNRVSKVVKGGKRFHFSAMVVVGDGNGRAGHAIGKAKEVSVSIRKGIEAAKKAMVQVPIEGETIPHTIVGRFGAGKVLLKPAAQGTGIIAGNAVRAVMEAAGIRNVVSKCLGSDNYHNVIRATFNAFQSTEPLDVVEAKRGVELSHLRKAKKGE